MPQVEGGPEGLNTLLEAVYTNAKKQGHSEESASKIAWAAAKQKYGKIDGKWTRKFYNPNTLAKLRDLMTKSGMKKDTVPEVPTSAKDVLESDISPVITGLHDKKRRQRQRVTGNTSGSGQGLGAWGGEAGGAYMTP